MKNKFSLKNARKAKQSIAYRNKDVETKTNAPEPKVKPGPFTDGECPPPEQIDILKVLKVFQECRLVETNEVIDTPTPPMGAVDVECLGAQLINSQCNINPADNTITGIFSFVTAYQFLDAEGNPIGDVQVIETLDESRTVSLARAGEEGLDCEVDIFLDCLQCFVSETGPDGQITEVTCCVGKQIVFKLIALVQLLVPTFGYVPVPPDCEQVAGECPDFTPEWPPYPPQPEDGTGGDCGTSSSGCSCK